MGKSSSQVVGYRYYSNYLAFIGNRIERLLGFNFNKQGWIPVIRRIHHSTYQTDYIHLPNHYGENEGGISGTVYTYLGDNYQLVDTALDADEKGEASAFPYQSYCCFNGGIINPEVAAGLTEGELQEIADQYHDGVIPGRGFYLGNSGYMKEMLLWVKRIHVKNNGDVQWHDSKSAIDSFNRYEPAPYDEYRSFQVLQEMTVRWSDPSGEYTRPAGGAAFPMSELGQSYSAGAGYNGDPLPEPIGISAAAAVLSANNMPADMKEGVVLSPVTWTSYPPQTDGFWNGAVVRYFSAKGRFYWNGGVFKYRTVLSKNGAQILISKVNDDDGVTLVHSIQNTTNDAYKYMAGEIDLPIGMYELQANIGGRYTNQGTPRPFLHFQVKAKVGDSVDAPDINPIHKIREILTDDTAMGKPESDINDVNFMKAADRIWDEGLGISWAIDEKSCIEAIEELCYHVEAGIRVNRQTGLYEMVLFRDDWFSEEEIHDIAESRIKDLSLDVMNSDDIVNQLNVTYYDRERIKNSTFSVYENGSILTMGHANAESVEFPYFMNMRNAEIVANWKLKQFSMPAWSGSFATGWKEARKWNRYDLIRLPWPKKWSGTILVRIMKINLGNGTDNTVTIDFEEVIPYSGEMNTSIVVDAPVESASKPPQPSMNAVFEAPYYLTVLRAGQTNADLELSNNPNIGYVAAIAAKPQSNSLNALLYTDGGVGEFEQASRLDYCDILQLDQPIIETTSSFTVNGSLTQIANSNNLILLNDELMGFVSFDNETKVLTVKRGVLDTIPRKHSTGSLFVFDLPDVAFDPTQYTESEVIEAQVLTTTPSGIQELNATGNDVEIKSRAIRPYPPANVKLNGEYWPVEISGSLSITWVHRNRLQQTGGDLIDWYSGSVTPEPDVTYSIELINTDTGAVLSSASGLSVPSYTVGSENLAPNNLLKIWSERNGYESLNKFFHNFTTTSLSPLWKPENLSLLPSILEYSESNVTVDGNGKVTSWGSSITAVAATAPTVRNDIYDFPVIHLQDANAFMRVPNASVDIMDNEFWAFMVLHVDGFHGRILDIGVNATISDGFSLYGNIAVSARRKSTDTPVTVSSLASSPLRMVYARVKWDSEDTLEISSNGKALSSTAALPSGVKPTLTPDMLLGRSHQGGNNAGAGYISVMFGNSTNRPNQSQIDKLFGWAAHKYGIANQLPMGHPYKTDPPRL